MPGKAISGILFFMDYQFLTTTPLFHGMNETEIKALLPRLSARDKKYRKGSIIYHAGNKVSEIGLILSGSVNIVVNFECDSVLVNMLRWNLVHRIDHDSFDE